MSNDNHHSMSDHDFGYLSRAGIEFAVLIPTETGLAKSIMDAVGPFREYLHASGYHWYTTQFQGQEHKVMHPVTYIDESGQIELSVSLYRPETKKGDPRIWISSLKKYARPNDVLVFVIFEGHLTVYNSSKCDLKKVLEAGTSVLNRISSRSLAVSEDANELMGKIHDLYTRGYLPTLNLQGGDTGVGSTLETHLGIMANSSRSPDYKGIEIKATRSNLIRRSQLFSKCPNWDESNYSAWETLTKFGYPQGAGDPAKPFEHYALRCTVRASISNPQGFHLLVKMDDAELWAHNIKTNEDVFMWGMNQLKDDLLNKHRETFWVKAQSRNRDKGKEEFWYTKVIHTRNPSPITFERLLNNGGIHVDFTMHALNHKTKRVRDHGYLFKIKPTNFNELFPIVQELDFQKG